MFDKEENLGERWDKDMGFEVPLCSFKKYYFPKRRKVWGQTKFLLSKHRSKKMFVTDELLFVLPERAVESLAEGQFARRILVLALEESAALGNRDFLTKILAAAQLDLNRDCLFDQIPSGEPFSTPRFIREKHPAQVLVFGLPPAQLGLTAQIPLYQTIEFYNTQWLFADALSVLEPDKTKKGLLWTALKALFLP